ncbi:MAG: PAS domain S-box protein [Nitrospirota bacterium]
MSGRGRVLRKLSGKSKPSKNRAGRTRSATPKGPGAEDCERTNALFKGIPVPTYAWKRSGEDFVLVDFNDAADASTHGRIGAMVGKTASALYRENRPDILEDFSRCFQSQISFQREMKYRYTTGEDNDFLVTYTFVPPDFVMVHTEEITERRRAAEELRQSEARFRALVENSQDVIFIVSADGVARFLNASMERILGYPPSEIIGRNVFDLIHPEDLPGARSSFMRAFQSHGVTVSAPFRALHADGSWIYVEVVSHNFTEDPRIQGILGNLRDVTDRKRLEDERLKTSKLESLGVLAGGIAHDFNNILTAILGNISIARTLARDDDPIAKRLTEAEKASLRARDLTQQLLTFAKGGAPIMKPASIAEIVRDAAGFALRGSPTQCDLSIPEGLWPADADEGQISQVIHNLVLNADQAMPEGGTIQVRCENLLMEAENGKPRLPLPPGNYLRISVADHGIGIPEEHLKRIFDPYFTTKQRGSGLGLATAYSIIRNHGGYIAVESRLGAGTTFHVCLPASSREIPLPRRARAGENRLSGNERVLVMEDEEVVRDVASDILTSLGYEVAVAPEGSEAVDLYMRAAESGRPFDAVIMDLTVRGGMGGREAVRRLIEINPAAKVIVSSGYSEDPVMADFRKYGFSGVVAKPYRIDELGAALDRVLREKE